MERSVKRFVDTPREREGLRASEMIEPRGEVFDPDGEGAEVDGREGPSRVPRPRRGRSLERRGLGAVVTLDDLRPAAVLLNEFLLGEEIVREEPVEGQR